MNARSLSSFLIFYFFLLISDFWFKLSIKEFFLDTSSTKLFYNSSIFDSGTSSRACTSFPNTIFLYTRYSITLKAATLFCYTELSNSAKMKVSSFSHLITIMEPNYQSFIFLSTDNSIAEFFTSTKLSSSNPNSLILY